MLLVYLYFFFVKKAQVIAIVWTKLTTAKEKFLLRMMNILTDTAKTVSLVTGFTATSVGAVSVYAVSIFIAAILGRITLIDI